MTRLVEYNNTLFPQKSKTIILHLDLSWRFRLQCIHPGTNLEATQWTADLCWGSEHIPRRMCSKPMPPTLPTSSSVLPLSSHNKHKMSSWSLQTSPFFCSQNKWRVPSRKDRNASDNVSDQLNCASWQDATTSQRKTTLLMSRSQDQHVTTVNLFGPNNNQCRQELFFLSSRQLALAAMPWRFSFNRKAVPAT